MNAELEKVLKPENIMRTLIKQIKNKNNEKLKKSLYMSLALTYNTQVECTLDSYSISIRELFSYISILFILYLNYFKFQIITIT